MKRDPNNKKPTKLLTAVTALLLAVGIVADVAMFGVFPSSLDKAFPGQNGDPELQKTSYANGLSVAQKIEEEGAVLLKNDGALPLAGTNRKINLLGYASANPVYGGTGSGGSSYTANRTDFVKAFTDAGFEVNQNLVNLYRPKNNEGGNTFSVDFSIPELPATEELAKDMGVEYQYTGDCSFEAMKDFSDTAVVVFSRKGGEGNDLPTSMAENTSYAPDQSKHYLELNSAEQSLLEQAEATFDNVIVLINSGNAMELGFLNDEGVDAALWIGDPGDVGTIGIVNILTGAVNPSGRLPDIYPYAVETTPSYYNFDTFEYTNSKDCFKNFESHPAYLVEYQEGIYVGYRYYETRESYDYTTREGENLTGLSYNDVVQFPFGYGLSYTTFEWSDYKLDVKDDKGTATLTVKNTGSVPGKDVVELYAQAPYTAGGVEKASVVLAGYAKTKELKPGESEKITVTFSMKDIASYDFITNKTWILDPGTYYVTAGRNAHDAVNNILAAKGFTTANGMTADGNAKLAASFEHKELTLLDTAVTGNKVTNRFDNDAAADAVYLSRSNWSAMDNNGLRYSTADVAGISKNTDAVGTAGTIVLSDELRAIYANGGADSVDLNELSKQSFPSKEDYVYGAEPTLKLVDMKGATYDDPRWDELLNQTKLSEQHILFNNSGYGTKAIEAIEKPKTYEYDGPAGVSNFITGKGGFGYANTIMLAATWNQALAEEYGKFIAEDCLITKTSGWYAPATNMHRSPFSGRNYEYFSEDPFQSGIVTANIIKNVQKKGVYVYMKHFALNDQETNRTANGQVSVWAQEQAIREIYLKPFQMGVEDGGALGIMLGKAISIIVSRTMNWATASSPEAMALAVGVSVFIGLAFGWYPSWKASKMDPIDALRHE